MTIRTAALSDTHRRANKTTTATPLAAIPLAATAALLLPRRTTLPLSVRVHSTAAPVRTPVVHTADNLAVMDSNIHLLVTDRRRVPATGNNLGEATVNNPGEATVNNLVHSKVNNTVPMAVPVVSREAQAPMDSPVDRAMARSTEVQAVMAPRVMALKVHQGHPVIKVWVTASNSNSRSPNSSKDTAKVPDPVKAATGARHHRLGSEEVMGSRGGLSRGEPW